MVGLFLSATLLSQTVSAQNAEQPSIRYLEYFARLHDRPVSDSLYFAWWRWLYQSFPAYRPWLLALRLEKEIGLGREDSARFYLTKLLDTDPPPEAVEKVVRDYFLAFLPTADPQTVLALLERARPYGFQSATAAYLWIAAHAWQPMDSLRADSLFRALVQTYPSSPYADRLVSDLKGLDSLTVGKVAFANGRYEEALRLLPPEQFPKEVLLSLYFLRKNREFLEQERKLRSRLTPPTRARMQFLRAITYERLNRYTEALQTLAALVRQGGPWGERAAYELSHLAIQKHWTYRVLKVLKPVAKDLPAAISRVALLYLTLDQPAEAWQWFRKNLHSPDDFYRAQALFYLYRLTGNSAYRDTLIRRFPLSYYTASLPDSFPFPPIEDTSEPCTVPPAFQLFAKLHEYAWALASLDPDSDCWLKAAQMAVQLDAPYLATRLVWKTLASPPVWDSLRLSLLFPYPEEWLPYLQDLPIDPFLFLALMREESHFHPWVISRAGAIGLAQLMPQTYQAVTGAPDPRGAFHPLENLRTGAQYLAELIQEFGDLRLAVAAYNAGPGAVRRWLKRWDRAVKRKDLDLFIEFIPYRETRNYVRRVLRSYRMYQRLYRGIRKGETPKRNDALR